MAENQKSSNRTQDYADSVGLLPVSLRTAAQVVQLAAYDRHVVLLVGETSAGKTAILQQLADYNKMGFVYLSLANKEASDITGPMMPSSDGMTYRHLPPENIPIKGAANAHRAVFLDVAEVNRGGTDVHNAVMQLWVDRHLGTHEVGENVIVTADMNPPDSDYAVSSTFSSDPAIRRRTCQVVVHSSARDTLAWAKDPVAAADFGMPKLTDEGVLEPVGCHKYRPWHASVIEFLQANIDLMNDVQARDAGKIFACPAGWHACSDTLYTIERLGLDLTSASMHLAVQTKLSGHVGAVHAKALLEYHAREGSALDPRDMLLHFADKDSVSYKRVQKLLEGGHGGRVAGALNNLAVVWAEGVAAGDFTSEECAPHLALIFNTVPTDIGAQLLDAIVDADAAVGHTAGGPSQRSTSLVRFLHKEPAFKEFRARRTANLIDKKEREQLAKQESE